ncbi:E3 ubiquitin-protein ligase TRIM39-like isoform X2 [Hemibagrus wyckioides]|uniref:E3 ubiquitin-protein ligase TRIM39-like isoform X2 n=1 Tax=Hemibagrus wyckioides TaxID=337641 RepID=UPI00266CF1D3|nr:E3 ubiquitin-protein ligase TRIM39-like isoform X2 [Hemibagrus wyckioides]
MWQGIQAITNYRRTSPACDSDTSLPDALNDFYARFEAQNNTTEKKTIPPPNDQVLCLTTADMKRTLCRVNPRKSAGPDNIPGRVLRECAEQLADVFTDIFNILLNSSIIPPCLKTTTIVPVLEKSTVSCLNDYRPVALTPIAWSPNRFTDDAITTTLQLALTHLDFMAYSRSLLSEDQLQCPICLDVFTDPVTTSCGHNFCMICLKEFWDSSSHCQCPLCMEEFHKHPELRVNTFISSLVAQFKEQLLSKTKKVLCDSCTEEKLEALKSCLHCGVSYCNTHLMPHKTTAKLMKHKLIDPVENLEDYICQKHERPLELFCRDDQMCVCQFCTEGEHETHNTVPLEEIREKIWVQEKQAEVQQLIQERLKKVREIKLSVELSKKNTEKEKADVVEIFSNLMSCIKRGQVELLKVMEETQKAAERRAEEFIKELEQEITELKKRNTELEQLSHTEDHLHLLQIYPSLCSPPHTQDWTDVTINTKVNVETLISLSQLQETLKLWKIIDCIQKYAVDVTLDPDTAHPYLILSDDGKQVGHNRYMVENLPDYPERFDTSLYVLGNEGFTSGRIYYEVQVHGKTDWILGVVRESIKRKGLIIPCPEDGYWCVWKRNDDKYSAWDSPRVSLSMKQAPQKVGVFVDYEEGLISFYDVDAKSHIYSFTGQTFTEKLYPIFSPCNHENGQNVVPLVICSRS